jgi:hypothetical protein
MVLFTIVVMHPFYLSYLSCLKQSYPATKNLKCELRFMDAYDIYIVSPQNKDYKASFFYLGPATFRCTTVNPWSFAAVKADRLVTAGLLELKPTMTWY